MVEHGLAFRSRGAAPYKLLASYSSLEPLYKAKLITVASLVAAG